MLTEQELYYLIQALLAEPSIFGPLIRVLLMTGQGRGEVAGLAWEELRDLSNENSIWQIPGNRTKNKQSHIVPLSFETQELILQMPRTSHFVFTTNGNAPVSGFGKVKARLDERIALMRRTDRLEPMSGWTLHDMRRTMVTVMNEKLGIAPHVVEAVVNHTSGLAKAGVAGVYNRALYLDERRRALCLWARWLRDLSRASTW